MDVCSVIKRRLEELGLEQKDLATAAEVTESYVSQLLARKKLPPAPDRTDIYEKMAKFLKLPSDRLSKLAELQRREELKRDLAGPPSLSSILPYVGVRPASKAYRSEASRTSPFFRRCLFGQARGAVSCEPKAGRHRTP